MLSTSNVAIQFGAKPLFEQVTVKFSDGNRYGLIGANGSGKSTLMKVLGGDLEPSAGDVMLQAGMRLGKLNQNQFGYEDERVLDVVMRGHVELWAAMQERDRIYADPNATDDDYMKAAELEGVFAEYGGYDAEARAASILTDAGIHESRHNGPMREVPPGLKLRVLLAQALFSRPDVLLLDEPTNNLDINSIRWLESALNNYDATMVIISHDRHFLNQVCTHVADLDFQQLKIYPGNYDDFMLASVQARARVEAANAKAKDRISDLQEFVRRFSANASKARQATSRKKQLEKIKIEEIRPSSRQNPYIRFEQGKKLYRSAVSVEKLSFSYPGSDEKVLEQCHLQCRGRRAHRHHRPERRRQDHADALSRRRIAAHGRPHRLGGERPAGLHAAGPSGRVRRQDRSVLLDVAVHGQGRRRPDRPRHPGPAAVFGRGDQEVGEGAVGRREGPHDLRQADADQAQCAADGRTHQPHGHGNHRVPADRPRALSRHAHFRFARSRVRRRPRHPHHRASRRRQITDFRGTYDEYLKGQGIEV